MGERPKQAEKMSARRRIVPEKEMVSSIGEISKRRQLNETQPYRVVRDLSFYVMRWILTFSFKHCLMNDIEIF